jgi:hypothetical protein
MSKVDMPGCFQGRASVSGRRAKAEVNVERNESKESKGSTFDLKSSIVGG